MASNVTKPPILDETGQEIKGKLSQILTKLPNLKGDKFLSPTPFIYSENEEQVGIWIDGKPLYQRTWDFGSNVSCASNTWVYVNDTTITNRAVHVNAFGTDADGTVFNCINVNYANSKIGIQNTRSSAINIRYLTVQYTKTTDTPWQGGYKAYGFSPIIYSETEREIGVWEDGKPLYQKTIDVNVSVSSLNTWFYTGVTIANADKCIFVVSLDSSGQTHPTNGAFSANKEVAIAFGSIATSGTRNIKKVTLQYTKTTDTAGNGKYTTLGTPTVHYTEDEQVIGTWVDGSTLYQKTINFGALPNNTTKVVAHSINNLGRIVKLFGTAYSTGNGYTLPLEDTDGAIGITGVIRLFANNTNVYIVTYRDQTSYDSAYITIQYTKTS